MHLGTATLRVSIALYGLLICHFGVYFANQWPVSRVKNDLRSFVVHLTLGILRDFQAVSYALAFFCLDGFAVPRPSAGTDYLQCQGLN